MVLPVNTMCNPHHAVAVNPLNPHSAGPNDADEENHCDCPTPTTGGMGSEDNEIASRRMGIAPNPEHKTLTCSKNFSPKQL